MGLSVSQQSLFKKMVCIVYAEICGIEYFKNEKQGLECYSIFHNGFLSVLLWEENY